MIRCLLVLLAIMLGGATSAWAVEFNHAEHLTYVEDMPCSTCHVADATEIVPSRDVCLECHDCDFTNTVTFPGLKTHGPVWALEHRFDAKAKAIDCASCHEQEFCLECHKSGFADEQGSFSNAMINVHRSDFHVTHPIAARTNPQLCESCHENGFCVDCHNRFAPEDLAIQSHRRGWSDLSVSGAPHSSFAPDSCGSCHPDSVLPAHEWSSNHAREARKDLVTCQACHPDGDVCLKCHSAKSGLRVNPHPDDWDDMKGRLKRATNGKTCRKCH